MDRPKFLAHVSVRDQFGIASFWAQDLLLLDKERPKDMKPADVWSFGCVIYHLVEGCEPLQDVHYLQCIKPWLTTKNVP